MVQSSRGPFNAVPFSHCGPQHAEGHTHISEMFLIFTPSTARYRGILIPAGKAERKGRK